MSDNEEKNSYDFIKPNEKKDNVLYYCQKIWENFENSGTTNAIIYDSEEIVSKVVKKFQEKGYEVTCYLRKVKDDENTFTEFLNYVSVLHLGNSIENPGFTFILKK